MIVVYIVQNKLFAASPNCQVYTVMMADVRDLFLEHLLVRKNYKHPIYFRCWENLSTSLLIVNVVHGPDLKRLNEPLILFVDSVGAYKLVISPFRKRTLFYTN